MAQSSRASGLWSTYSGMSYADDVESEGDMRMDDGGDMSDGRTPLDRTIDRIGMGSYQWTLLSLCGFGWLADNMWIQAIAVIMPRVQQHFAVPDSYIGTLSSSMFAGMMFGAIGWGTCSDLMGRTTAFNATLFLTSVFGIFASFANTFIWLCVALFFLGSAVGGSMPTDGTLLLEHMPNGKQYLVTALSVFFSFGAVLAAVVGLLVIPSNSCPPAPAPCDVGVQNMGWKYLLVALGVVTLSLFLARMVFFRLHESPRYLVHAGRPQEAVESLQLISKFNGSELSLDLQDVQDHVRAPIIPTGDEDADNADVLAPLIGASAVGEGTEAGRRPLSTLPNGLTDQPDSSHSSLPQLSSQDILRDAPNADPKDYSSMAESSTTLNFHSFNTPDPDTARHSQISAGSRQSRSEEPKRPQSQQYPLPESPPRSRPSHRRDRSTTSSFYETKSWLYWHLPRWFRRPLWAWLDRVGMVLSPEWFRNTVLVWGAWGFMSLAYTMFNVFLPKLLETRAQYQDPSAEPKSLEDSLWDVVIYALGGCPGAILGAYLIESPLGRRRSLAGSTFVTALFCWVFVVVEHPWAVRASTVGISLSATAMWAVLYGWTPEIFGTKVRGTACGIASALSRIGGMIAPILGGALLTIDHSFPVYFSIVIFLLAVVCVLLLDEHEGDKGGGPTFVH